MGWIVHPYRQEQGIGAAFMSRLLRDRPEPWATLASDPRSAAHGMYAKAGWQHVGASHLPWGPLMDLLVPSLTGPTAEAAPQ